MHLPSVLLLALALSLIVPGRLAAQAPVLLVLGDSLSAAYGLATEEGWVDLLRHRLNEDGRGYLVINASISGETTAGGLSRLPGLLEAHGPAIVLIALGANDGLRGLPFGRIRDNLRRMIQFTRKEGGRVLLAGIRLPPNYGAAYTEGFQAVFTEVADSEGVPLVPLLLQGVEGFEMMQPDGIHPSAAAQPRILDNLWPALRPLLEAD